MTQEKQVNAETSDRSAKIAEIEISVRETCLRTESSDDSSLESPGIVELRSHRFLSKTIC